MPRLRPKTERIIFGESQRSQIGPTCYATKLSVGTTNPAQRRRRMGVLGKWCAMRHTFVFGLLMLSLAAGCGDEQSGGKVPDGWSPHSDFVCRGGCEPAIGCLRVSTASDVWVPESRANRPAFVVTNTCRKQLYLPAAPLNVSRSVLSATVTATGQVLRSEPNLPFGRRVDDSLTWGPQEELTMPLPTPSGFSFCDEDRGDTGWIGVPGASQLSVRFFISKPSFNPISDSASDDLPLGFSACEEGLIEYLSEGPFAESIQTISLEQDFPE